MKKFRLFLNFDKESKWLQQMASKGWQLKKQGPLYTFEKTEPDTSNIKIDYRYFKSQSDFLEYRTLFEDSGWQHLSGSKFSGNQYFKQISNNSGMDIFSDEFSRTARYKRLANSLLSGLIIFLPLVFVSFNQGTLGIEVFTNPRELYLTPGIWDLSGTDFWRAFLFETPFALMRGFSGIFGLLIFLCYVSLTIKSWMLYKKATKLSNG